MSPSVIPQIDTLQQGPSSARPVLGARAHVLVALFAIGLLAPGLSGRVLNYHEARYALAAKEMAASGHWLVPMVLGAPRVRKPPFTYWAIAASLVALRSDAEWVVRLPSLLAAVAVALMIARATARWLGESAGLLAGLVQASSAYVILQGGLADPDMLLCAAVVSAYSVVFAALDTTTERAPRRYTLWFHGSLGIAFLIKGPIGVLFVVGPTLLLAAGRRFRRQVVSLLTDPTGIAVLFVLVAVWPALVLWQHPDALREWTEENLGRFEGELGQESVFFYFWVIPLLLMPWTPFTVAGAWRAFRREEPRKMPLLLLAAWFSIGAMALTVSAGKHERYAAPILPPLSVFAAIGLAELRPRLPRYALAGILAATGVVTLSAECVIIPRLSDRYRDQADCARRVDLRMPKDGDLYLLDIPNNRRIQLAYYLTMRPHIATSIDEVPESGMVLAPAESISRLTTVGRIETLEHCVASQGSPLALARVEPRPR